MTFISFPAFAVAAIFTQKVTASWVREVIPSDVPTLDGNIGGGGCDKSLECCGGRYPIGLEFYCPCDGSDFNLCVGVSHAETLVAGTPCKCLANNACNTVADGKFGQSSNATCNL